MAKVELAHDTALHGVSCGSRDGPPWRELWGCVRAEMGFAPLLSCGVRGVDQLDMPARLKELLT